MQAANAEDGVVDRLMTTHQDDAEPIIHAGGTCTTWRALARVCLAEALGTALLVLAACAAPAQPEPFAPLYAGLTVAMLVQWLGWVSGAQLNPCVTLAALSLRRMRAGRALAELAAQLAGATLGAAAGDQLLTGGVPLTLPQVPLYKAVCVEGVCTMCLVLANCGQWQAEAEPGAGHTWPLRIGTVVAALTALAGKLTGASMNPARSFGAALVGTRWRQHWVYWMGPLGGALVACAMHRVLRAPAPAPAAPCLSSRSRHKP